MNFKHQGDVTFTKVSELPEGSKLEHSGKFVLALGKTTGHKHVITADPLKMTIIETPQKLKFIFLEDTATVTHEEHLQIVLQPGIYQVGAEREKDWFSLATRNVVD